MRFSLLLALVVAAPLVLASDAPDRNAREALASLLGAPLDQLPESQLVTALEAGSTDGRACSFAVCLKIQPARPASAHYQ